MQFSPDVILDIRRSASFCTDDDVAGFRRFWSADRSFPISIAYPSHLGDPFYDGNRLSNLLLDFGGAHGSLSVTKSDLAIRARHGDQIAAQVVSGGRTVEWLVRQEFEMRQSRNVLDEIRAHRFRIRTGRRDLVRLGSGDALVPQLEWDVGSHSRAGVFFAVGNQVWDIGRDVADLSEADFLAVVASFRWLNDEYFQQIPVQEHVFSSRTER